MMGEKARHIDYRLAKARALLYAWARMENKERSRLCRGYRTDNRCEVRIPGLDCMGVNVSDDEITLVEHALEEIKTISSEAYEILIMYYRKKMPIREIVKRTGKCKHKVCESRVCGEWYLASKITIDKGNPKVVNFS